MWINNAIPATGWSNFQPEIDFLGAKARIESGINRTPVYPLPPTDTGLQVLGKMENHQKTGSFKARGALNNLGKLTAWERSRGVVASSSGNHGQALAWAA